MPALKKNEKIMLGAIGVLIVAFVIMDPYYFIYRDPPVPETAAETPAKGTKPGAGKTGAAKPAAAPTEEGGEKPLTKAQMLNPKNKGKKAKAAQTEVVEDSRPRREPIVFTNWGRDPFVQAKRSLDDVQAISTLKLGGLSVRGADRYALINSQILREGDMIDGMTISRIEPDRVILMRGAEKYTLTWGAR